MSISHPLSSANPTIANRLVNSVHGGRDGGYPLAKC